MPKSNPDHFRMVSYNILNGGVGRHEPIAETLRWLDGDVVSLIEADDPDFVSYLAHKLDYDHVLVHADTEHHVAMLSRLPIDRAVNLKSRCPALHRTALEAVLTIRDQPLRVIAIHLRAGITMEREAVRMRELDELIPVLLEIDDLPTVLMGDFNANAPYHHLDIASARPKTQARLAEQNGEIPYDVIHRLTDLGFTDSYHAQHPTGSACTLSTGYPAQRVDYIWLDQSLAGLLVAADVETGGFTRYCSDHYPVWADLNL